MIKKINVIKLNDRAKIFDLKKSFNIVIAGQMRNNITGEFVE